MPKLALVSISIKAKFLIIINSQIVSITLADDEMYKLCLWSGP